MEASSATSLISVAFFCAADSSELSFLEHAPMEIKTKQHNKRQAIFFIATSPFF
jgi:hypothetical protein